MMWFGNMALDERQLKLHSCQQALQWTYAGQIAPPTPSKLRPGCDNSAPIAGGVTCRHRQLSNCPTARNELGQLNVTDQVLFGQVIARFASALRLVD